MQKTENYQLNQWDPSDRVAHTDFNADNAKIDAALKAQADAIAAEAQNRQTLATQITKCGNCQIVSGTYAGRGTYGSDSPNCLYFPRKPLFIFITPVTASSSLVRLALIQGCASAHGNLSSSGGTSTVTWSGNNVYWYSNSTVNQCNVAGTYLYVAFLAMDA